MAADREYVSLHLGTIGSVYLYIPIDIITRLCLRPIKYLKYLGWAILDLEGVIHSGGEVVEDDAQLIPGGSYVYVVEDLASATPVNVKVANKRTESQTRTSPREAFRTTLEHRDPVCIFTRTPSAFGLEAVHIVPFARGEEWLQAIIRDRTYSEMEDVPIDDVHLNHSVNGFIASSSVHTLIDAHRAAVLQTPNPMLSHDDVRQQLHPSWDRNLHYPKDEAKRYIFQWLNFDGLDINDATQRVLNCLLAVFSGDPQEPQPSPLLLHYMYGCAVLRLWGRNVDVLADHPRFAHAPPPTRRMLGPPQTRADYGRVNEKREAARSNASPREGDLNESDEEEDGEWHRTESGTWQRLRRFHDFDAVQDLVLELTLRGKPERRRAIEAEKEEWESHMRAWVAEVNSSGVPPEDPQYVPFARGEELQAIIRRRTYSAMEDVPKDDAYNSLRPETGGSGGAVVRLVRYCLFRLSQKNSKAERHGAIQNERRVTTLAWLIEVDLAFPRPGVRIQNSGSGPASGGKNTPPMPFAGSRNTLRGLRPRGQAGAKNEMNAGPMSVRRDASV
ncbi:hypothetical protein OE88DRAFT_1724742 [Heliocybe sulcata]|uniref:HNH nuclease domain-containing protein n=1 Tax=Heliocybe sulcata TaxID=5364 RepID=A0A5C3N6J1_9AGAM|nr:hypothetical protein OE88DRAFT_1724742 [Heliocybe sulcata]